VDREQQKTKGGKEEQHRPHTKFFGGWGVPIQQLKLMGKNNQNKTTMRKDQKWGNRGGGNISEPRNWGVVEKEKKPGEWAKHVGGDVSSKGCIYWGKKKTKRMGR